MITHRNPIPPPPIKLPTIHCSGCGAVHNNENCPFCGREHLHLHFPTPPLGRNTNYYVGFWVKNPTFIAGSIHQCKFPDEYSSQ